MHTIVDSQGALVPTSDSAPTMSRLETLVSLALKKAKNDPHEWTYEFHEEEEEEKEPETLRSRVSHNWEAPVHAPDKGWFQTCCDVLTLAAGLLMLGGFIYDIFVIKVVP